MSMKITAVAIDTEDLITAVARLLALSKTADTEGDRDAFCHSAAEWTALLHLDPERCKAKASEILDYARQQEAAQWN
jgi:hypothetical protein